jgi:hypothetical protein
MNTWFMVLFIGWERVGRERRGLDRTGEERKATDLHGALHAHLFLVEVTRKLAA